MKPDILFTGKGHAATQATLEAEFAVQRLAPGRYAARAIVLSGARPLGTIETIVKR